ncbi:MAG: hypothetical protein C0507_02475 [Cyanobacteria bacterium PR.3.49]|nr:hypothetical protein [Cyanobacteria bacterium PR.3.49]
MAQISARQYDAHYRRLGLAPGATVEEVDEALRALRCKLEPARLNRGPLRDIAPFRLQELAESARLIVDYWQLHTAAPPSILGRYQALLAAEEKAAEITKSSPQPGFMPSVEVSGTQPAVAAATPKLLEVHTDGDESEIRKAELFETLKPIGPGEPKLNFSYFLFKHVDGAISPHADVLKPRSIIGLLILGMIWVWIPPLLVRLLGFFLHDLGIETWLQYFSILAQILPICFAPPLVMYEYAFFRQLQFPFLGVLRLPFEEAVEQCISRLTVSTESDAAATWTIDSKRIETDGSGAKRCEIKASYSGLPGESKLPLKLHLYVETLAADSSFLAYWFDLDWQVLFKGRAVSRIRSARFELDRLIKEN